MNALLVAPTNRLTQTTKRRTDKTNLTDKATDCLPEGDICKLLKSRLAKS